MEPSRKETARPHILCKFFGKLRGSEHQKMNYVDKTSFTTILSESTGSDSIKFEDPPNPPNAEPESSDPGPNIDLRYGGQCLTPEQLPEFCDQLHRLIDVIRNIQSYSKVTGEYPSMLERRLIEEAREVASLAAEVKNAQEVLTRTRLLRRAVRAQKKQLSETLSSLKETEARELEGTVRISDRKLFRSWESLKDSTDPMAFEPLIEEVRGKQTALDCLLRLIENRQSILNKQPIVPPPPPPPLPLPANTQSSDQNNARKRHDISRRAGYKRRRKESNREPRSVPLSNEPSQHSPATVAGTESNSRYRAGSAGAVTLTPYELPSSGSVRDIVFFTAT